MANENKKPVTGVSLNKSTLTIKVNSSEQLIAIFSPTDATNQKVTWSSSNGDVATVDANGHVAGLKEGNATITVTTEDGNKTATCEVIVDDLLQLYQSDIIVKKGDTFQLTALYIGTKKLTWSSNNTAVATVNANGKVTTGNECGEATITVTTTDISKTDTCTVKVVSETTEEQSTWIDKYVPLYDKEQNGYILAIDLKDKNNVDFTGQILTQGNLENFGGSIFISETETLSCLLTSVSFHKEVYQPGVLELVIDTNGKLAHFGAFVTLGYIEDLTDNTKSPICHTVAKKYYIFEKKKKGRYVTLRAYSVDKFLTIDKFNQAFTRKKFVEEMVESSIINYKDTANIGAFYTHIDYDGTDSSNKIVKNLHHISYKSEEYVLLEGIKTEKAKDSQDKGLPYYEEPLMPYSVQYEESFYDFLVRMCNRSGEFLYCEDNKLHIGVPQPLKEGDKDIITKISEFDDKEKSTGIEIEYNESGWKTLDQSQTLATNSLEEGRWSQIYGGLDNNATTKEGIFLKTESVSGNLISSEQIYPNEYFTKIKYNDGHYAEFSDYLHPITTPFSMIKHLAESKNLIDGLTTGVLAKWLMSGLVSGHFMAKTNKGYKDTYFKDTETDYYQFVSEDLLLSENFYNKILEEEKLTEQGQLIVTCPTCREFKLGQIVQVENSFYVVYRIKGGAKIVDDVKEEDKQRYKERYELLLLPVKKETEKPYVAYPLPMLERRIRKATPQRAKVTGNFDPDKLGRVRVVYPWQLNETDATPWLRVVYPMASGDSGFMFIPTKGDEVLIDYEEGNVERPFVSGSFYNVDKQPSYHANMHMQGAVKSITSANGHHISFTDIPGGGQFLTSLLPICSFFGKFGLMNDWLSFESKYLDGKNLAGGFEIADYLGVYSIKGSTQNRNITISSPVGNIVLDAFEGITINAPLGDVNIVGKNVNIEARNNLTMTSGMNIANPRVWTRGFSRMLDKYWYGRGVAYGATFAKMFGLNLSTYRTWLEVLLRPIGGTMLIKSHRFMRLEAGKGESKVASTKYRGKMKHGGDHVGRNNRWRWLVNSALESEQDVCENAMDPINTFIENVVANYNKINDVLDSFNRILEEISISIQNNIIYDIQFLFEPETEREEQRVLGKRGNPNSIEELLAQIQLAVSNEVLNDSESPFAKTIRDIIVGCNTQIEEIVDNVAVLNNTFRFEHGKTFFKNTVNAIKERLNRITSRDLENDNLSYDGLDVNVPARYTKEMVQDVIYNFLRTDVWKDSQLQYMLKLKTIETGQHYNRDLITKEDNSIKYNDHLKRISKIFGLEGAYDDHAWSKKDEGTILFAPRGGASYQFGSAGEIIDTNNLTGYDPTRLLKEKLDGITITDRGGVQPNPN